MTEKCDPDMDTATRAAEQTQARRERIKELEQYGEQLAQRLDHQEAGKVGRGRRATDRSAYTRFSQAVVQAHLSLPTSRVINSL